MTPNQIKAELILKGIKQIQIAHELKVTRSLICQVIQGKTVSKRVQKAISKKICRNVEELWPEHKRVAN